jgi:hypothetical protein
MSRAAFAFLSFVCLSIAFTGVMVEVVLTMPTVAVADEYVATGNCHTETTCVSDPNDPCSKACPSKDKKPDCPCKG